MKPFQLIFAYPAVEFIQQQNRAGRRALAELLETLKKYPHNCKDLTETQPSGREHFVFLRSRFAIKFWIDEWECEVKVLHIQFRDR
jgi:hypothetical protein